MKVLFVGDIHNHSYMLDDITKLDKKYKLDKIIFLGDYVDDWNTNNMQSIDTLYRVIKLKLANPEKIVLLLGNHEFSYLGKPCSGHMYYLSEFMEIILKDYINLFELYSIIELDNKQYVCTHAGITNDFIYNQLNGSGNWKLGLERFNEDKLKYINALGCCSGFRGGVDKYSSFLWADMNEHIQCAEFEQPLIPYQIVGHTPVKNIIFNKTDNYEFIFIDTHSTYRNGMAYGDKSYLLWNDTEFKSITK